MRRKSSRLPRLEELVCPTATITLRTTTDRRKYVRSIVAHVAKSFELAGATRDVAARNADTVMTIETSLAKATLTRVEQRDPYNLFHKLNFEGLQALTPDFNWSQYLRAAGLNRVDTVNVTEPEFYKELARQWNSLSLDDIKTYLLLARNARLVAASVLRFRRGKFQLLRQDAARCSGDTAALEALRCSGRRAIG